MFSEIDHIFTHPQPSVSVEWALGLSQLPNEPRPLSYFDAMQRKKLAMVKRTHGGSWQVMGMLGAGYRPPGVERALGIPRSTVYDIAKRNRIMPESVADLPWSWRPRKTSAREDRDLCRLARQHKTSTSTQLRALWDVPGAVRRRLRQSRFRVRRPARKPRLSARHKEVSVSFCS